ncbi:MAG: hypothetical protein Q9218_007482 [Villophora microphyllina]
MAPYSVQYLSKLAQEVAMSGQAPSKEAGTMNEQTKKRKPSESAKEEEAKKARKGSTNLENMTQAPASGSETRNSHVQQGNEPGSAIIVPSRTTPASVKQGKQRADVQDMPQSSSAGTKHRTNVRKGRSHSAPPCMKPASHHTIAKEAIVSSMAVDLSGTTILPYHHEVIRGFVLDKAALIRRNASLASLKGGLRILDAHYAFDAGPRGDGLTVKSGPLQKPLPKAVSRLVEQVSSSKPQKGSSPGVAEPVTKQMRPQEPVFRDVKQVLFPSNQQVTAGNRTYPTATNAGAATLPLRPSIPTSGPEDAKNKTNMATASMPSGGYHTYTEAQITRAALEAHINAARADLAEAEARILRGRVTRYKAAVAGLIVGDAIGAKWTDQAALDRIAVEKAGLERLRGNLD